MAVLSIKWDTNTTRVSPANAAVTAGDQQGDSQEAREVQRADKPMLVWVLDPVDEEANQKIEKVVLDPDKVRVGCAFFKCIKMSAEDASKDPLLADAGKKTPRLILITTDYEVAKVVEGKISTSKLFSAMKKAAKKSFECNFEKDVKSVIKILNELDKIANEKERITEKENKGELSKGEQKKLAKEKEELEEHEKEVLEKRAKLLNPELKSA